MRHFNHRDARDGLQTNPDPRLIHQSSIDFSKPSKINENGALAGFGISSFLSSQHSVCVPPKESSLGVDRSLRTVYPNTCCCCCFVFWEVNIHIGQASVEFPTVALGPESPSSHCPTTVAFTVNGSGDARLESLLS